MKTLRFDITGMSCGGCTGSVHRALSKIDGVSLAQVTLQPGTATVIADPARLSATQIESVISQLGYVAMARPAHSENGAP